MPRWFQIISILFRWKWHGMIKPSGQKGKTGNKEGWQRGSEMGRRKGGGRRKKGLCQAPNGDLCLLPAIKPTELPCSIRTSGRPDRNNPSSYSASPVGPESRSRQIPHDPGNTCSKYHGVQNRQMTSRERFRRMEERKSCKCIGRFSGEKVFISKAPQLDTFLKRECREKTKTFNFNSIRNGFGLVFGFFFSKVNINCIGEPMVRSALWFAAFLLLIKNPIKLRFPKYSCQNCKFDVHFTKSRVRNLGRDQWYNDGN